MVITSVTSPIRSLTEGPYHHFFGYFDKSPWSPASSRNLLAMHRTMTYNRMPKPGESIEIGIVDPSAGTHFEKLGTSSAWNLQQGSMMQWHPMLDNTILYNDIQDGEPCAVALEVGTGNRKQYSRPFAAVSPDGRFALSYNFGRLTVIKPEYGYAGLTDPFAAERLPEEDGIWKIDLFTGKSELIHSLAAIAATGLDGDTPGAVHYLNHALFNRDGRRFCFLHRYINPAGTQHTRMLSCNTDGSDLRVLISGMASHFGWRNSTEVMAWAGERAMMRSATSSIGKRLPVGKVLKKLYRMLGKPAAFKSAVMKDRYILFNHADNSMRTIAKGMLATDGHCSFSPDGNWFVTDTYPDKHGMTKLYVCNWNSERVYTVQELKLPVELDNEVRCDLHPRWHPEHPLICVDSAHTGARQMYEIDVSRLLNPS